MSNNKRRPLSLAELPFQRRPAVRWFSPGQLVRTARQVVIAGVFAGFSDKREVQAALPTPDFHDHSEDGDELWLDYVADVGDGFDATYSVAYLLAQPELDLPGPEAPVKTRRGQLLVLGGDEVYPTPSSTVYEERMRGPYAAALPQSHEPSPTLLAIPGNHDWYDGLTAFLRIFCQGSWIGGWRTEQRRSYFAVKLPHGWWFLGLDSQLNSYLDSPQVDYFKKVATLIGPDDAVIVATARPSWVGGGSTNPSEHGSLDYFLERVLGGSPGKDPRQVRLLVSGDQHHYARYAERDGDRQLLTCGGGGAYLSATHRRPTTIVLPPPALHSDEDDPPATSTYDLACSAPDQTTSARLLFRVIDRLPLRNPGFVVLMVLVQLLLAHVLLASADSDIATQGASGGNLTPERVAAAFRNPQQLILAALVLLTAMAFSGKQGRWGRLWGLLHGAAHVGIAVGVGLLVSGSGVPAKQGVGDYLGRILISALVAGVLATLVMGLYLVAMGLRGLHLNEAFSAQSIEDHKCFLRLHLNSAGDLTVHPVAVTRTGHAWETVLSDDRTTSWLGPKTPLTPRLIERPIRIPRKAGT